MLFKLISAAMGTAEGLSLPRLSRHRPTKMDWQKDDD